MIPKISLPLTAAFLLCSCTGPAPESVSKSSAPVAAPPASPTTAIPPAPAALQAAPAPALAAPGIANRRDVHGFIAEMSRKHGFGAAELNRLFDQVRIDPSIIDAMRKPYEAKPWYTYRKLFLTDTRIHGGIEFRRRHAADLAAAEAKYGVDPDIITAILGVESSYGQKPGKHRVIDALSTLAFEYPKRAEFFRAELAEFLLLCREEGMDALAPVGSYAGAMGMPQFMPSSYRHYAADGDGDRKRDIWSNPADAIASVARYFAANGWHRGEPIAVAAVVHGNGWQGLASKQPKASHSLAQLAAAGVEAAEPVRESLKAGLVQLEGETGPDHWLAFHNFSVVMRYNHSPLYAMAAYELSRAVAAGQ